MFNNSTGFTMPVAPMGYGYGYSNNGNNGMFGDGGWWAILILFALFGGFGRGGFGGFGGGNCATQSDVREAVDQQTLTISHYNTTDSPPTQITFMIC